MAVTLVRAPLLADVSLTGAAWCRAHSDLVDDWLDELLTGACGGGTEGLALVAVGGYGRSELCPNSDIDVMLLHHRRPDVAKVAEAVWYPIWDAGLHLGHSVATVREALGLAADDLDTATALLSARGVAGDPALAIELATRAKEQWAKRARRWLAELAASVERRHASAGDIAFLLEPDLKEGRGGLRDQHALVWAEAAQEVLLDYDLAGLASAYGGLLDVRVELHRVTGRPTNVLTLQEQDAVAAALGLARAEDLMARIAAAGRTIAWTSDDVWRRVRSTLRGPPMRIASHTRQLGPGVVLRDGEVSLDDSVGAGAGNADPALVLRIAALAANQHSVIERHSLERLAMVAAPLPSPWPDEGRDRLVELLLAGSAAIPVIEALDQRGLWAKILPEWALIRSRPQHNAYHRFTVDRHLLETAANAVRLVARVDRPDLLMIGALLHDIGKGRGGDHTSNGVIVAREICERMGYGPDDVSTLTAMVEHHLLLADVATRRDLDDPATIDQVAAAVGTLPRLQLLAALTEADSLATGPAAWGSWKAQLLGQLVERVAHVLGAGASDGSEAPALSSFPTEAQLARLLRPEQQIEILGQVLTIVTDDRPGIFSRVAGVLALHGLDVLRASAYSSEQGRALAEFFVSDPIRDSIPWGRITADLERVLDGRLALNARISERAHTYNRNRPAYRHDPAEVRFDNQASAGATVIDVHTPDRIGALYRITRALSELDLDIRSARVETLGAQVVDSFYVRDRHGAKLTDKATLAEIERAVLHSLAGGDGR